jgi:hypothetical protein
VSVFRGVLLNAWPDCCESSACPYHDVRLWALNGPTRDAALCQLMLVELVDVVTAALTSVTACRKNPKAMALWVALIVAAMLFGYTSGSGK